ncbi:AzlD domain-containing protein [Oceanicella actignis]|uniref:Branched-chain amino acid transport protein n=1 Tax=Oceanicella actignis TaxID=1189325 RepID=A0A1M7TRS6_9RHOB|nr:AzlD domain-containing protein [Oceanicella actignis]TYO85433.1 branched-subunit amino acid transport protein [Oceanicella actignis]SET77510.1 Branched-chain amino acid transport protein [Oceanicella actignis]SHN73459.1 Branched-chain amino acid transport protein [Oceanicella actignis]
MTPIPDSVFWSATLALGLGTFLIRFSFLGLIGGRPMPGWAMRLLRYVPTAVLPALVAPLIAWPAAAGGQIDPARLAGAAAALMVGAFSGRMLGAVVAGMGALYAAQALMG